MITGNRKKTTIFTLLLTVLFFWSWGCSLTDDTGNDDSVDGGDTTVVDSSGIVDTSDSDTGSTDTGDTDTGTVDTGDGDIDTTDNDTIIDESDTTDVDTTDGDEEGVVIASERTESMTFHVNIDSNAIIADSIELDLADIRKEIAKENITLSTFNITNVTMVESDTSAFSHNLDKRCYLQIIVDNGDTAAVGLVTPFKEDNALTLEQILAGVELNDGLVPVSPAYGNFIDAVQDMSKESIMISGKITFLDTADLVETSELTIEFTVEGQGKKSL